MTRSDPTTMAAGIAAGLLVAIVLLLTAYAVILARALRRRRWQSSRMQERHVHWAIRLQRAVQRLMRGSGRRGR